MKWFLSLLVSRLSLFEDFWTAVQTIAQSEIDKTHGKAIQRIEAQIPNLLRQSRRFDAVYERLEKLEEELGILKQPRDLIATPDLAPALRQLVAYIVVSAYRGSDQEGVMAAIEEVWGPIEEHLVASGVLAKEEA